MFGVGAASLCSDPAVELVTSLLPTFVTATLQRRPGRLGAIDGTADALTGLATLAGGPLANDPDAARPPGPRWLSGHRGRHRCDRVDDRGLAGRSTAGDRLGFARVAAHRPATCC